jgi:hypothetical protein
MTFDFFFIHETGMMTKKKKIKNLKNLVFGEKILNLFKKKKLISFTKKKFIALKQSKFFEDNNFIDVNCDSEKLP